MSIKSWLFMHDTYLSASGAVKNSFLLVVELLNGTAEVVDESWYRS